MSECRLIAECAFYNDKLPSMPATAEFIKMIYCHQRAEDCLRMKQAQSSPVNELNNATTPIEVTSRSASG